MEYERRKKRTVNYNKIQQEKKLLLWRWLFRYLCKIVCTNYMNHPCICKCFILQFSDLQHVVQYDCYILYYIIVLRFVSKFKFKVISPSYFLSAAWQLFSKLFSATWFYNELWKRNIYFMFVETIFNVIRKILFLLLYCFVRVYGLV